MCAMPEVVAVKGGEPIYNEPRAIASLNFHDGFKTLFNPEDAGDKVLYERLESGYDKNDPVSIWKEEDVVIDGHRRIAISKMLGREAIQVAYYSFACKEDARWWAIGKQIGRRNLTPKERAEFYAEHSKRVPKGQHENRGNRHKRGDASRSPANAGLLEEKPGYSKEVLELAEKVKEDPSVVYKELAIQRHADPAIKGAYLAGAVKLDPAYRAALDDRNAKAGKPIPKFTDKNRSKSGTTSAPIVTKSTTAPPEIKRAVASVPLPKEGQPLMDAEREFFGRIPLRNELAGDDAASPMDNDLRLFLMLEGRLKQMREDVLNLLGPCSKEWLGPFHQAVSNLISIPPPTLWDRCRKCDGQRIVLGEGTCKRCRGLGYSTN